MLIAKLKDNCREWPFGHVMETYPGDDGLVRVVKVRSKSKGYIRPVHRLCPLLLLCMTKNSWTVTTLEDVSQ